MTLTSDWVDDLLVEVPAAMEETVDRAVVAAIQSFFRVSEAWRYEEDVYLYPGVHEFALSPPADTYVASLLHAVVTYPNGDTVELKSVPPHQFRKGPHGDPAACYVTDASLFVDGELEGGVVHVSVVVQPKRTITAVPDSLGDKWFDYIRSGAMARLLTMADRPWTDMTRGFAVAATYEARFDAGVELARREARGDRSRPVRTVAYGGY